MAVDPSRLFQTLFKTNLKSKDPVLYQLLYDLIGGAVQTGKDIAAIASNTTTGETIINNTEQIIQIVEGNSGNDGDIGLPGPIGPTGSSGPIGMPGLDGNDGDDGLLGPQGLTGATGPQGPQGPQGPAGTGAGTTVFISDEEYSDNGIPGFPLPADVAYVDIANVFTKNQTITVANQAVTAFAVRFNSANPLICFGVANSNGFGYFGWNCKAQVGSDIPTYDINGASARIFNNNATGDLTFQQAGSGIAGNPITYVTTFTISIIGVPTFIGQSGSPNYVKLDNTINAGGRIYRIGDTGALSTGLFSIYDQTNNQVLLGLCARARITGQTTNQTICSFTPGSDGTFGVIMSGRITASTGSPSVSIVANFTDPVAGAFSITFANAVGGTFAETNQVNTFRAKGGTTITITTNVTGTATYNAEGTILQFG